MKKYSETLFYLLTTLLIGQFLSCSKNPHCWLDDKNKGIVIDEVKLDCQPYIVTNQHIITDEATFKKIYADTSISKTSCALPDIDFNEYSLLVLPVNGGCNLKCIREVTKNENGKNYHYKVTYKSCGICKSLVYADNLVKVPKLPSGWTVTFETKEKK